jgi:hypothetical protein
VLRGESWEIVGFYSVCCCKLDPFPGPHKDKKGTNLYSDTTDNIQVAQTYFPATRTTYIFRQQGQHKTQTDLCPDNRDNRLETKKQKLTFRQQRQHATKI